ATVIASCRFVAQPLEPFARSIHVVYNGVARPATPAPAPRSAPRVGVIARIAPEKGQADFVAAARRVAPLVPGCRFLICGAPLFGNPEAERYAASLSREPGSPVELLDWRADVSSVLAGLDLLVAPSSAVEATTRTILEAYAAGVPVVAYDAGGISEILIDNETGFLVRPATPEALGERIAGLLTGPRERLDRVAERARAAWRDHFTIDRYQRRIVEVICAAQTAPGSAGAKACPEPLG
ncbi:MAG: glycosyltransferase family 4 protein, partial [Bryobacteraceae bacterium]